MATGRERLPLLLVEEGQSHSLTLVLPLCLTMRCAFRCDVRLRVQEVSVTAFLRMTYDSLKVREGDGCFAVKVEVAPSSPPRELNKIKLVGLVFY